MKRWLPGDLYSGDAAISVVLYHVKLSSQIVREMKYWYIDDFITFYSIGDCKIDSEIQLA